MAIATVNLPVTDDTYSYTTNGSTGTSIMGAGTSFNILSYNNYLGHAFSKYDLSALSGISSANILEAEVRFYFYGSQFSNPTYAIKRVLADWSESTLNFTNQPARSASYLDCPALSGYGWKSHDITTLVKEWVAGTYPNYGIAFEGISNGYGQNSYLYSKEYNGGSHAPYIYVEYEEGSTPAGVKFVQII